MSDNLTESDFSSIQERITQVQAHHKTSQKNQKTTVSKQPTDLLPFGTSKEKDAIHFTVKDYLELADWSGRAIHPKKRGYIDSQMPNLLTTLGIEVEFWIESVRHFSRQYGSFAVGERALRACANDHHRCWHKGVG